MLLKGLKRLKLRYQQVSFHDVMKFTGTVAWLHLLNISMLSEIRLDYYFVVASYYSHWKFFTDRLSIQPIFHPSYSF